MRSALNVLAIALQVLVAPILLVLGALGTLGAVWNRQRLPLPPGIDG